MFSASCLITDDASKWGPDEGDKGAANHVSVYKYLDRGSANLANPSLADTDEMKGWDYRLALIFQIPLTAPADYGDIENPSSPWQLGSVRI